MIRLSPRQINSLALCIIGDGNEDGFTYRTHNELDAFFEFVEMESRPETDGGSRIARASSWVGAANRGTVPGGSDLPTDMERLLTALLDRREFASGEDQEAAQLRVSTLLAGLPIEISIEPDRSISIQSSQRSRGQNVLEEQIHTVFETVISDSDLVAARLHYAKAKRFLEGSTPDFENAAKEAVASIEALATAITGESDLPAAIRKATQAGRIPRPLDELIIKLYAYRGNEPGVSHGQAAIPEVTREDAEFVFNLAGSIGAYLRQKLERS